MNQVLPERYAETIHRLALGIEPVDALRGARVAQRLTVGMEGVPRPARRLFRHSSCRYVLLAHPDVTSPVTLRFDDAKRRFVPRRLTLPLATPLESGNVERRRRPALFPGAAYEHDGRATGLRGLVVRDGAPLRWARVIARLIVENGPPRSGAVVGHAHGDDRGEFLLLLEGQAAGIGGLRTDLALDLEVTVYGPVPKPAPPDPVVDPLWDLPDETVGDPVADAEVLAGHRLPDDYVPSATSTKQLTLALGRVASRTNPPFVIF